MSDYEAIPPTTDARINQHGTNTATRACCHEILCSACVTLCYAMHLSTFHADCLLLVTGIPCSYESLVNTAMCVRTSKGPMSMHMRMPIAAPVRHITRVCVVPLLSLLLLLLWPDNKALRGRRNRDPPTQNTNFPQALNAWVN